MPKNDDPDDQDVRIAGLDKLAFQLGRAMRHVPELGTGVAMVTVVVVARVLGIIGVTTSAALIAVGVILLAVNFYFRLARNSKKATTGADDDCVEAILVEDSLLESTKVDRASQKRPGEESLPSAVKEFFHASPFLGMGAGLLLLVLVGVFFNWIDSSGAFMIFVLGCMGLYALHSWVEFTKLSWLQKFGTVLAMLGMMAFVKYVDNQKNARPKLPPNAQPRALANSPVEQTGKTTQTLWQAAVASRHLHRFGPPMSPVKSKEDFDSVIANMTKQFDKTRDSFRSASHADPQLRELVQRLVATDERELAWANELATFTNFENQPREDLSAAEALNRMAELTEEQWVKLPPAMQDWFTELFSILEERQNQRTEIESMRHVLRTRYPNQSFPLPELPAEPEAHDQ
ncbi:hypothetical protein ACYFX5_11790 [Bremerella sp. T1]|uniref:hypothetical protein n=1 Tax=Bremerella sp. TYQ1 TaxID=3119568 RepID=UPI001CCADC87|nr:hypothetical protein [Bremerella volcania]UBM33754.1 hypothetical protein LA756_13735 [Bremerella volcania]